MESDRPKYEYSSSTYQMCEIEQVTSSLQSSIDLLWDYENWIYHHHPHIHTYLKMALIFVFLTILISVNGT